MSGYYWGLTALSLLRHLPVIEKDALISWVLTCQHEDGGFGGSPEGDSHLLYTLSALQVLALFDSLDKCDRQACATCALLDAVDASHYVIAQSFQSSRRRMGRLRGMNGARSTPVFRVRLPIPYSTHLAFANTLYRYCPCISFYFGQIGSCQHPKSSGMYGTAEKVGGC